MEQDLLILDTMVEGPLFAQGGLVVASPDTVIATVSVKSTLRIASLKETVANQNSVRQVVQTASPGKSVFCGGYFFATELEGDKDAAKLYRAYEEACAEARCPSPLGENAPANPIGPDMLCSDETLALKAVGSTSGDTCDASIRGFHCDGLAAAVLVASVLESVAIHRGKVGAELSGLLDNISMVPFTPPVHEFTARFA
jgi:hypothetical protein